MMMKECYKIIMRIKRKYAGLKQGQEGRPIWGDG